MLGLSFGALQGCGLTPGYSYHSAEAAREQRTADDLRRAGAGDAARAAQSRADAEHKKASHGCDGFLACLVDLLFYAWLEN